MKLPKTEFKILLVCIFFPVLAYYYKKEIITNCEKYNWNFLKITVNREKVRRSEGQIYSLLILKFSVAKQMGINFLKI